MPDRRLSEREKAIARFKLWHGNHSHEVIPMLDVEAMIRVAELYRGRVDFSQYPAIAQRLSIESKPMEGE